MSSSKNELEPISKLEEEMESPSPQADTLTITLPRLKWQNFAKKVLRDEFGPQIRELSGFLSCACVLVYVSGYTTGHWVREGLRKLPFLRVSRYFSR